MWSLFSYELRKYKQYALIASALHGVLLVVFLTIFNTFDNVVLVRILYPAIGFAFAAQQMYTHIKNGQWVFLINRPIATRNLFFALVGAGLCLLSIIILLPLFLNLIWLELTASTPLSGLNYFEALHHLATAILFYASACFLMLSATRLAVMAISIPLLIALNSPISSEIFLLLALAIPFTLGIALFSFKPNLHTLPRNIIKKALTLLPLQFGMYVAIAFSIDGLSASYMKVKGGAQAVYTKESFESIAVTAHHDIMNHAIDLMETLPSAYWWHEANYSVGNFKFTPRHWLHPNPASLLFTKQNHLVDNHNGVQWVFDHREKLFRTRNIKPTQWFGHLGKIDNINDAQHDERFTDLAYPMQLGSKNIILHGNQLYTPNFIESRFDLRLELHQGEHFYIIKRLKEYIVVISDQRLFIFDDIDLRVFDDRLTARMEIALPAPVQSITTVQLRILNGGYLIAILANSVNLNDTYHNPTLFLGFQLIAREFQELLNVKINKGGAEIYRNRDLIISPLMSQVYTLISRDSILNRSDATPLSNTSLVAMGGLSLVAFLLTAYRIRHTTTRKAERYLWLILSLINGIPSLLCCFLLTKKAPPYNNPSDA